MPIAYPFPPHMQQQQDPAQQFARGLQIGTQAAQARETLRAQREANAQRIAIQQQELEQESIRDQQRLLIDKAYKDAQIGLEEQKVRAAQEVAAAKTQEAAQQFKFQQMASREIMAGGDPAQVWMKYGPLATGSAAGLGSLVSATKPVTPKQAAWIPADLKTGAPGHFETPSGAVHIPTRVKDEQTGMTSALRSQTISYLRSQREELKKAMGRQPTTPERLDAWKLKHKDEIKQLDTLKTKIEDLLKPGTAASVPAGMAPPSGASSRVKVTDPNGKKGTIPIDQLDDALAAGWTEGW